MTERCEATTRRAYSEGICEPTPEEAARAENERERNAAAEAARRRDAYFAANTDEGGRTKDASSDTGAYAPFSPEDLELKDSLRTKAIDKPLEEDVVGNMIVAAAAGGLMAGVRAGAVTGSLSEAVSAASDQAAKGLVKRTVKHIASEAMKPGELPASPKAEPAPRPSTPAGMSSGRATSVAAPEPTMSIPEQIPGPLVIRG